MLRIINAEIRRELDKAQTGRRSQMSARSCRERLIITALTCMMPLAGCKSPCAYPLSGQSCAPEDPVRELRAREIILPCP